MASTTLEIEITLRRPGQPIETIKIENHEIKRAVVTDEIDPISLSLPASEFEFEIYSEDPRFSLFNDLGYALAFTQYPKVKVTAKTRDVNNFIGTFYIEERNSEQNYVYSFRCIDIIGLMENLSFDGAYFATARSVYDVLLNILSPRVAYDTSEIPSNTPLKGFVAPGTLRNALHQVAFAAGAVVTTTEAGGVKLSPTRVFDMGLTSDYFISKRQKIDRQEVTLEPFVSSIAINTREYSPVYDVASIKILFEQSMEEGEHEVILSEPHHSIEVGWYSTPPGTAPADRIPLPPEYQGVATITPTKIAFGVRVACTVVIEGGVIRYNSQKLRIANSDISHIVLKNDVEVAGMTMADLPAAIRIRAMLVQRFFHHRYIQETEIIRRFAPVNLALGAQYGEKKYSTFNYVKDGDAYGGLGDITTNSTVAIETIDGKVLRGIVEMMELDLAGGMIAKLRIRGNRLLPSP